MDDPIRHVASCQLWVRATEQNLTRGTHVPNIPYVPHDPLGGVLVDHSFTHILPRDPNLNFTQFLLASDLYVLKRTEPFYQLQHWFTTSNWTTGKGRAYASLYANPVLVTTDNAGVPQNPMVPVTAHSKMTRPGMPVRTTKQKSELFKRMFKIIVEVPFAQYERIDDESFHSSLLKGRVENDRELLKLYIMEAGEAGNVEVGDLLQYVDEIPLAVRTPVGWFKALREHRDNRQRDRNVGGAHAATQIARTRRRVEPTLGEVQEGIVVEARQNLELQERTLQAAQANRIYSQLQEMTRYDRSRAFKKMLSLLHVGQGDTVFLLHPGITTQHALDQALDDLRNLLPDVPDDNSDANSDAGVSYDGGDDLDVDPQALEAAALEAAARAAAAREAAVREVAALQQAEANALARLRRDNANTIQRLYRGGQGRVNASRRRENALLVAVTAQRLYRGGQGRINANRRREIVLLAAITAQRLYRGGQGRANANSLLQETKAVQVQRLTTMRDTLVNLQAVPFECRNFGCLCVRNSAFTRLMLRQLREANFACPTIRGLKRKLKRLALVCSVLLKLQDANFACATLGVLQLKLQNRVRRRRQERILVLVEEMRQLRRLRMLRSPRHRLAATVIQRVSRGNCGRKRVEEMIRITRRRRRMAASAIQRVWRLRHQLRVIRLVHEMAFSLKP